MKDAPLDNIAPGNAVATLSFPGGSAEFPVLPATDGASAIDIATLTKQTGLT
ncbi:MAG TPA: citrate (Si)-synthase, partial [Terrimesophilobacter sp.]|nr:citrate (Si)-synthase [Terrimesophilobacter sp.]